MRRVLRRVAPPVIVIAISLALYAPTWSYPFLWDDKLLFLDSTSLSSMQSLGDVVAAPYRSIFEGKGSIRTYYRPASLAALVGEHRLFGAHAFGYRVVHTALHLVCCLLVFALLAKLAASARPESPAAENRTAAFAGTVLFAIAPSGIDTVLFLTSLGDQMVLASTLVALFAGAAFSCGRSRWHLAWLVLSSAVCVFSKESGAWLPFILAAYCAAVGVRLRSARFAAAVGTAGAAAAAMIALRSAFVDDSSLLVHLGSVWRAIGGLGQAFRFTLVPHPLGLEVVIPSAFGWEAAAGLAVAALLVTAIYRLRFRRIAAFGIAWWLFAVAPALAAVAISDVLASRYLYVPAIGLACLATTACLAKRRPACLAVGGLAAIWILFAVLRVHAWSDDLRLWSREAELNPDRASSLVNLARALRQRGRGDEAEAVFVRAIAAARSSDSRTDEANARANLCDMLTSTGRMDAALAECAAAVQADSSLMFAWLCLGNLHAADGAWEKALRAFTEAARRDPSALRPMISIAGAAAAIGDRTLALRYLDLAEAAIEGSPERRADLARRRALVLERLDRRKDRGPAP